MTVSSVRSFNRFYTRVIGVLHEGLMHTDHTLAEARVLFELGQRDATEVSALRRDLDLDPGYLSRMLAKFEADGLITRSRSDADARRQVVALTPSGGTAYKRLDARATEEIEALLAPLAPAARDRLVSSMDAIRRTLEGTQGTVELCPPGPGDLGWIVARHGALYAAAQGWDASFEAMVGRIVADYAAAHDPATEATWIARVDGEPAGSVMCVRRDATTAQLRMLLVEPSARGLGLGTTLVDTCVEFARAAGYADMVLWTFDVLADARRIYQRAGFTLAESTPQRAFGHDLVGQYWRREL